jgi:hypothetical protein
MNMNVKLLALTAFLLVFACGCKLETSSANPNANANANAKSSPAMAANAASAEQSPSNCSLRRDVAPVLHGLKLGMSPDEVLALFPESKDNAEVKSLLARAPSQFGGTELVIHPQKYQSKDKFPGIDHINFSFLDGHAHTVNVGYAGPAYAHVDEFINKFVTGTSLPSADQWQAYPGMDTQMKTLTCQDFEVRVFAGGEGGNLNYVLLTDLEASKTLKDRRAKARAQAKPTPSQ